MLTTTKAALWAVLMEDEDADQALAESIKPLDLDRLGVDFSMSENHIGGDDVVGYVDAVLEAVKKGYTVCTWYGPGAEVLIVGYRPAELTFSD